MRKIENKVVRVQSWNIVPGSPGYNTMKSVEDAFYEVSKKEHADIEDLISGADIALVTEFDDFDNINFYFKNEDGTYDKTEEEEGYDRIDDMGSWEDLPF